MLAIPHAAYRQELEVRNEHQVSTGEKNGPGGKGSRRDVSEVGYRGSGGQKPNWRIL